MSTSTAATTATTGNTTTTTTTTITITTTATTRTTKTTTTITTTTTEILSNSNSSCRLLDCLNNLPPHDQRVFHSLLGHIGLLRLSACCRSLRNSIRNDTVLWQALYHRDFLSGAYYVKEMDFVLWCVRTDVNNPCTSDKRADLLENVDWYNTYRRRVSTENNWRYGRCNTTHIDMKAVMNGVWYRRDVRDNRMFITRRNLLGKAPDRNYTLEYLPHSNLRSSNRVVYNSTFSTSLNVLSLDSGNETKYRYVLGDHYIAAYRMPSKKNSNYNVKILTRKHGSVFTTFDIPVQYRVKTIQRNWVLLVNTAHVLVNYTRVYKANVMVFDIDSSIMCPGSIDGTCHATCFYKTTSNTAIVYMAKVVEDDETGRIEWALHQFSSNNPVVQLRSGWFQLPERIENAGLVTYNSYDSHVIIKLRDNPNYDPYIMHSVASNGQSHTPRNCYTISKQHIPIPLLRAGCDYLTFNSDPAKIWTDLSYNDDQVLQIPDTIFIRNIIGDLYVFITKDFDHIESRLLVDISTKEIIRKLKAPNIGEHLEIDAMVGTIYDPFSIHQLVIQEYGEL